MVAVESYQVLQAQDEMENDFKSRKSHILKLRYIESGISFLRYQALASLSLCKEKLVNHKLA